MLALRVPLRETGGQFRGSAVVACAVGEASTRVVSARDSALGHRHKFYSAGSAEAQVPCDVPDVTALLLYEHPTNLHHQLVEALWVLKLVWTGALPTREVWLVSTGGAEHICEKRWVESCRPFTAQEAAPRADSVVALVWTVVVTEARRAGHVLKRKPVGYASQAHPQCFRALQPWRRWVGGAAYYDRFRSAVLRACGSPSLAERSVVLLTRPHEHRLFKPSVELLNALVSVAAVYGYTVTVADLEELPRCEQATGLFKSRKQLLLHFLNFRAWNVFTASISLWMIHSPILRLLSRSRKCPVERKSGRQR